MSGAHTSAQRSPKWQFNQNLMGSSWPIHKSFIKHNVLSGNQICAATGWKLEWRSFFVITLCHKMWNWKISTNMLQPLDNLNTPPPKKKTPLWVLVWEIHKQYFTHFTSTRFWTIIQYCPSESTSWPVLHKQNNKTTAKQETLIKTNKKHNSQGSDWIFCGYMSLKKCFDQNFNFQPGK